MQVKNLIKKRDNIDYIGREDKNRKQWDRYATIKERGVKSFSKLEK